MNKNFKKLIAGALAASIVVGSSVATVQAATRITPAEKKEFKRYLTNGMEYNGDYEYFSSEKGPILSPNFCLYDVNNDGHKDLIVSGVVGIRELYLTEIYMHVGKKYVKISYDGMFAGVGKKGILIEIQDYGYGEVGEGGIFQDDDKYVYQISTKGKSTEKLHKSMSVKFSESDMLNENAKGKVLRKIYTMNGKKTTQKKYTAEYKKYAFKKVTWHTLTDSNIQKYIK